MTNDPKAKMLQPISALPFDMLSQRFAHLNMSSHATGSTRMIDFLAWVEVNKKKLVIGVAIIAVAIAAYSIYQWHRNEAEAEATAALYKIQIPASQTEKTGGPGAQAFLQIAAAHPGTSAGAQALLFGAEGLFRESKFAEAKTRFESFLRTYPDHPMAPTAAFGIAACLDAMDKTTETLTAYQDVVSRFAGSVVASQAKLGLARLYETKGDLAQALKIYDELARPTASSAWGAEASARREQLLAHHPEWVRTNPPAPVFPSTLSNAPATNLPPLELKTNPAPAKTTGPP
jgi:predicted negative regulator of RcsB-dependent stress response